MPQKMQYRFCGIPFTAADAPGDDWWRLWEYKLDPYLVPLSDGKAAESGIVLRKWPKDVMPVKKELLRKEYSGFFTRAVYRADDEGTIWSLIRTASREVYLEYHIDAGWKTISLVRDLTGTGGMLALEYMGQFMPAVLLNYAVLSFHGALLEDQNRGIIISAPSGTGKTTHARLWRDLRNSLIINGDRAVCRKINGRWTGCGLPWSGTSGEQVNRSVPLSAFVVLEQSPVNRVERLEGIEGFRAVMPGLLYPAWDYRLTEAALDYAERFLAGIPVFRLFCRPDSEAVWVLAKALEKL